MRSSHQDRHHEGRPRESQRSLFHNPSVRNSGRPTPSSQSRTTSPHFDHPYLHGFQRGEAHALGHSPAVVRRRPRPGAPPQEGATQRRSSSATKGLKDRTVTSPFVENGHHADVRTRQLTQLLEMERSLRLAAERRTLESDEKGARATIVIEANYGARLLYSIFVENIAALPSPEDVWKSVRVKKAKSSVVSPPYVETLSSRRPKGVNGPIQNTNTYEQNGIMEENVRLREELEQYRSIDREDRREINELHRNMQQLIERLTKERDEYFIELKASRSHPARSVSPTTGMVSSAFLNNNNTNHISSNSSAGQEKGARWHFAHLVDPSAANMEESPELAFRRRVLPKTGL